MARGEQFVDLTQICPALRNDPLIAATVDINSQSNFRPAIKAVEGLHECPAGERLVNTTNLTDQYLKKPETPDRIEVSCPGCKFLPSGFERVVKAQERPLGS